MNLDYLIKLKNISGLTIDQIASVSGVPESTVKRIFSGKTDNPYFQTIIDIVKSLDGSIDEMELIKTKEVQIMPHETESRLILLYREIIRAKNKWIKFLVAVIAVLVSIFILFFFYDILNPTIGWFRA